MTSRLSAALKAYSRRVNPPHQPRPGTSEQTGLARIDFINFVAQIRSLSGQQAIDRLNKVEYTPQSLIG